MEWKWKIISTEIALAESHVTGKIATEKNPIQTLGEERSVKKGSSEENYVSGRLSQGKE